MDQFQTSSFFQRCCLPIRSILVHILYYRLLKTYHNECAAYFVLGHFNFFQRKLKPILKFCTIYYALAFRFFFFMFIYCCLFQVVLRGMLQSKSGMCLIYLFHVSLLVNILVQVNSVKEKS